MNKQKILTEESVRQIVREEIRIDAIEQYNMRLKIDKLVEKNMNTKKNKS